MADDAQSLASTSRPGSPVGSLPGVFPNTRQPAFRFNWDPAQRRRQGPGSVLSDNESRMDFGSVSVTPRNDIFNLSSATLSFGALPNDWSSVRHGFHGTSHKLICNTIQLLDANGSTQPYLRFSIIHGSGKHLLQLTRVFPQFLLQTYLAYDERTLKGIYAT